MKFFCLLMLMSLISYSNFDETFYDNLYKMSGLYETNKNEMLVRRFYEKYNYIQEYEKEKYNEDIPRNEVNLRIGIFYLFQKENDKEAEKYFFKSLNEDKNLDSYLYLGLIYFVRENYDQAEKYLKIASEYDDSEAMLYLSSLYAILGYNKPAIEYFNRALEVGNKRAIEMKKEIDKM